jgi:hypothetical protein
MNADLKQLSLDILRDIYGSSRRLALYPLGHPITQETLKKPLTALNEIFTFKHSVIVELFKDRLLAEGVLLDENVYVSGMALEMKKHKLANIIFHSDLTVGDLYHFLSILVSRPGPFDDNVARILASKNIKAISVNSDNPTRLFSYDKGDLSLGLQFSLQDRINSLIADKPDIIVSYYLGRLKNDDDVLELLQIDFRLSYLTRFFRDALLQLNPEKGLALIENTILSTSWLDDSIEPQTIQGFRRLFDDFLSANPDEKIISSIYRLLKKVGATDIILNQVFNQSSFLKLKVVKDTETIVDTLKYSDPSEIDPDVLKDIIFKLAASSQKSCLHDLINQLFRSLMSQLFEQRQKAKSLISAAAESLISGDFSDEFNDICKETVRASLLQIDNTEPVELISELISQTINSARWREFRVLINTLRGIADDKFQTTAKGEMAFEKLTEIAASKTLYKMAVVLSEQTKSDESVDFFDGLVALRSSEIIRLLAGKITHSDINVRSRMIKLLVSMKNDSALVLIAMLKEMIKKYDNNPISDDDWYLFRNIMRVLKEVHSSESISDLEVIAGWPSTKLKLEVIKTLEGMQADKAMDLLVKLSQDNDGEIRKAAVVGMGLLGDGCMVPHLRDIYRKYPECRLAAVASMGRIGNDMARDTLVEIFEDPRAFKELNISKKDGDEIKATIIKALSVIGDETAIRKIAEYSAIQPDKSIFNRDLLSNTAKILLGSKIR